MGVAAIGPTPPAQRPRCWALSPAAHLLDSGL